MALIIYKNAEGKRVPGVTTVGANIGWGKDGLMWWAWNEGVEGRDYKDTSGKAAEIGTIAHKMVEYDLRDIEFDRESMMAQFNATDEMVDKAETAYSAWLEWKDLVKFELLGSEISLVSERHQCGGTIDIAAIQKRRAVIDIKTSKAVYPGHLVQIAAYGAIWNENFPEEPIDGYYLLRLGKEDGSFHYHFWPDLSEALEAFELANELHQLHKKLKKRV